CVVVLFSSRSRPTSSKRDWSSGVCSSDLSFDERHLLMIPPRPPFTKSADFSVEYLRASAAASETDTTGGTSSKYLISASASRSTDRKSVVQGARRDRAARRARAATSGRQR